MSLQEEKGCKYYLWKSATHLAAFLCPGPGLIFLHLPEQQSEFLEHTSIGNPQDREGEAVGVIVGGAFTVLLVGWLLLAMPSKESIMLSEELESTEELLMSSKESSEELLVLLMSSKDSIESSEELVGSFVGLLVGIRLGFIDGCFVGIRLGFIDGCSVAIELGLMDGCSVGVLVGFIDGCSVDIALWLIDDCWAVFCTLNDVLMVGSEV
eukprot:CAMPEP_0117819626 /NCGR_PEP_ID=MMETSP0949-20121206/1967_1 /TAXON_ID=44440 /ORGANISM="Chattonella subsalsa, Strain CCMP2191" /LENGTH=209 /DNA_ID=CAMNT_0005658391 /DNA_START=38 /DNA_END=668 /DNA_ORIENTATION=-